MHHPGTDVVIRRQQRQIVARQGRHQRRGIQRLRSHVDVVYLNMLDQRTSTVAKVRGNDPLLQRLQGWSYPACRVRIMRQHPLTLKLKGDIKKRGNPGMGNRKGPKEGTQAKKISISTTPVVRLADRSSGKDSRDAGWRRRRRKRSPTPSERRTRRPPASRRGRCAAASVRGWHWGRWPALHPESTSLLSLFSTWPVSARSRRADGTAYARSGRRCKRNQDRLDGLEKPALPFGRKGFRHADLIVHSPALVSVARSSRPGGRTIHANGLAGSRAGVHTGGGFCRVSVRALPH